jgi:hypothetical protein
MELASEAVAGRLRVVKHIISTRTYLIRARAFLMHRDFLFINSMKTSSGIMIDVFHGPPTDAQLAPYKMTRKDWEKDHQAQLATNNQQLKDCPGGSYHVSINLPGIETCRRYTA